MKLIKILIATFALLSIATPSQAQNVLGTIQSLLNGRPSGSNGLPPTNLDSFVYQSGYNPNIYGDEGTIDIPPLFSFQKQNRINAGIQGQDAAGLTTGHGSWMPDAWGADEFIGNEWDMSGAGTSANSGTVATLLNATQAAQAALQAAAMAANQQAFSNTTSNANVNGTPITPTTPSAPATPATPILITFMAQPPAWISAFGSWATQVVPYAVTQGMVPVQDSTNGQLMGWMAPGTSLSQFLSGSTGLLLPSETTEAQSMLQNLSASNNYVVPGG